MIQKRELCTDSRDVLTTIKDEVQKHFQLNGVLFSGLPSQDVPEAEKALLASFIDKCFILQRWSSKWNDYVDVTSGNSIKDKDKLTKLLKNVS